MSIQPASKCVARNRRSLTVSSYDGEDDDSRPVEEPVETSKRTPEPMSAPVETEPAFYDPVESTEEVNVKTEPGQGFQGVHGIQNDQQDPVEEFDKPIGIKEDG